MAFSLPDLFQRVRFDASSARSASSEVEHAEGRMHRSFGAIEKAAALVGVGIGAAELVKFTKESIDAGREAERNARLTEAAIKSTGGAAHVSAKEIEDYARSHGALIGVQDDLIVQSENLLLRFTNIRDAAGRNNDVYKRTETAILDVTAATGKGLTPVTIAFGKALNDPIKGLGGLARVGIQFSKGQQDQIKGLIAHNKLLDAQKVILDAVSKRFGGAAVAAADPIARFHVVLHQFQEDFGKAILPLLNRGITFLSTTVIPGLEHFGHVLAAAFSGKAFDTHGLSNVIGHVGQLVRGIVEFVKGDTFGAGVNIGRALGLSDDRLAPVIRTVARIRSIVTGIVNFVRDHWRIVAIAALSIVAPFAGLAAGALLLWRNFAPLRPVIVAVAAGLVAMIAASKVITIIHGITESVKAARAGFALFNLVLATNPIVLIVGALVALGAGLVYAYMHSKTFRDVVHKALADVESAARAVARFFASGWHVIVDAFNAVRRAITPVIRPIIELVGAIARQWTALVAYTRKVWPQVSEAIGHVLAVLRVVVFAAIAPVLLVWMLFHKQILDVLHAAWDAIGPIITAALGVVVDVVKTEWAVVLAVLRPALDLILATISIVWRTIGGVVRGALEVVRGIIQTVLALINGDWGKAWDGVKEIVAGVWHIISAVIGGQLAFVRAIITASLAVISGVWNAVWGHLGAVVGAVFGLIGAVVSGSMHVLGAIISGGLHFIGAVWSAGWHALVAVVGGWFHAVGGAVSAGIHGVVTIVSRLKSDLVHALASAGTWLLGIGRSIIDGIVQGIREAWHKIVDAVESLASHLPGPIKKLFRITSPSRMFAEIGQQLSLGLAAGIVEGTGEVTRAAQQMAAATVVDLDAYRSLARNGIGAAGPLPTGDTSASTGGDTVQIGPNYAQRIDEAQLREYERRRRLVQRRRTG